MGNKQIMKQAIELLQNVNSDELETIQINHTKYDDGSVGVSVELVYPAKEEEEVTCIRTKDGEFTE